MEDDCILRVAVYTPFEQVQHPDFAKALEMASEFAQDWYCYMLSFAISNQL